MLNTVIDKNILEEFIAVRPTTNQFEDITAHDLWNSFFKYLKSGSNLQISADISELDANYPLMTVLNSLTTGRDGTKFIIEKFKKPHNGKLPGKIDINTVFLLDLNDDDINKLRKKNGLAFIGKDKLLEDWSKVCFFNNTKIFPITKKEKKFEGWPKVSKYVYTLTDVLFVDSFIFSDQSLLESNLYPLLYYLTKNASKSVNLTILSYQNPKYPIKLKELYEEIKRYLTEKQVRVNLSIALATRDKKPHDRAVISNYFMITSGDSFNYFNSKGEVITKGTDIRFESFCNPSISKSADARIVLAIEAIDSLLEDKQLNSENVVGDIKSNQLLFPKK
jgi:hypothetical protein